MISIVIVHKDNVRLRQRFTAFIFINVDQRDVVLTPATWRQEAVHAGNICCSAVAFPEKVEICRRRRRLSHVRSFVQRTWAKLRVWWRGRLLQTFAHGVFATTRNTL